MIILKLINININFHFNKNMIITKNETYFGFIKLVLETFKMCHMSNRVKGVLCQNLMSNKKNFKR